jgi:4-methyl-5(b-hydroxyethyl)-thiazole monophosphate biosynthesis
MAGAVVTGKSVAVAGNMITGRGIGAAIPFALKLVEMPVDKGTADKIAEGICFGG